MDGLRDKIKSFFMVVLVWYSCLMSVSCWIDFSKEKDKLILFIVVFLDRLRDKIKSAFMVILVWYSCLLYLLLDRYWWKKDNLTHNIVSFFDGSKELNGVIIYGYSGLIFLLDVCFSLVSFSEKKENFMFVIVDFLDGFKR